MPSEFPRTFYRYDADGEREGKTFASAEAVEAGWLTWEEFAALPAPKLKPKPAMPTPDAVEAGKRIAGLESELVRARDTVKVLEAEVAAKDRQIAALTAILEEKGAEAEVAEAAPKPKRARAKA